MTENLKNWLSLYDEDYLFHALQYLTNLEEKGYTLYPDVENVFKAFELCPIEDLKVVILGQDPYCEEGFATGLAFANERGVANISPSLKIIRHSVINPYTNSTNKLFDQTLESWAKQGVLLLNSALTVIANQPGSNLDIWRDATQSLLKHLSESKLGIIYVLLGEHAKSFRSSISQLGNTIITDNHPAYYYRTNYVYRYTFFNAINQILTHNFNEYINWYENVE